MTEKELLRKIWEALCKLELPSSGTTDNTDVVNLLTDIKDLLQNTPQYEGLQPIAYCDAGETTGFTAFVLDEESQAVLPVYFDSTGQPTGIAPTGTPCDLNKDYEFKFFTEDKCDEDGNKVKEVLCISYINGEEVSNETFWIVNGVKINTEPIGLTTCEKECSPSIESFMGDSATLTEYNQIEVFLPKCCNVTIITSAGNFTIPASPNKQYYTKKFDCFLTSYSITSDCEVDTIMSILTKTF